MDRQSTAAAGHADSPLTFKQAVPLEGVGRVAVPRPVLHPEQAELLRHLRRRHRTRYVLLVGKDEEEAVLHLPVAQDPVELLPCLVDPVPVVRVDDKDEPLRARVVVPPEWSDLVLPSDVLW